MSSNRRHNKYIDMLDQQRTEKDKIPYSIKKNMSVDKYIINLVNKHLDNDDYKNFSYYVIIGLWSKNVKTQNNTFTNFPLVGIAEADNIGLKYNFYEDDILPTYFPIYGEDNKNKILNDINNKKLKDISYLKENYGIKIIEYEVFNPYKGQYNFDKIISLDDDMKNYILNSTRYKQLISDNTAIPYYKVYRHIATTYTLDCGLKHKLLKFTVEGTNMIYYSCVFMMDRGKNSKEERVFDNVLSNIVYKYKSQRTNMSYKYTVPIELIYRVFDKIIQKKADINNDDVSPYKIIEKEEYYIFFGEDYFVKTDIV